MPLSMGDLSSPRPRRRQTSPRNLARSIKRLNPNYFLDLDAASAMCERGP
jgi:hypothetical protein